MSNAVKYTESAHAKYRASDFEGALELYQQALDSAKLPAHRIALHSNRAACFLKLKNYKKAAEECSAVLQLDPNHVGVLLLRAQTLQALKDYQGALFDVGRLLELKPGTAAYISLQTRLKDLLAEQHGLGNIAEEDERSDGRPQPNTSKPAEDLSGTGVPGDHVPESSPSSSSDPKQADEATTSSAPPPADVGLPVPPNHRKLSRLPTPVPIRAKYSKSPAFAFGSLAPILDSSSEAGGEVLSSPEDQSPASGSVPSLSPLPSQSVETLTPPETQLSSQVQAPEEQFRKVAISLETPAEEQLSSSASPSSRTFQNRAGGAGLREEPQVSSLLDSPSFSIGRGLGARLDSPAGTTGTSQTFPPSLTTSAKVDTPSEPAVANPAAPGVMDAQAAVSSGPNALVTVDSPEAPLIANHAKPAATGGAESTKPSSSAASPRSIEPEAAIVQKASASMHSGVAKDAQVSKATPSWGGAPAKKFDYSKWESLDVSDSDEEEEDEQPKFHYNIKNISVQPVQE